MGIPWLSPITSASIASQRPSQEYMCAVGIVPSDQAFELEDESQGHRTLMRLAPPMSNENYTY